MENNKTTVRSSRRSGAKNRALETLLAQRDRDLAEANAKLEQYFDVICKQGSELVRRDKVIKELEAKIERLEEAIANG